MPKLIIGNWKLHPRTKIEGEKLYRETLRYARPAKGVKVVSCPPATLLDSLQRIRSGKSSFALGAQDMHWEQRGPFTGALSGTLLKSHGADYVILGHSERREMFGETDVTVNRKVRAALSARLRPVICVGERERDHEGAYFMFVRQQITNVLKNIPRKAMKQIVIAYEPIWAISSHSHGKSATATDVLEMILFIQKTLSSLFSRSVTQDVQLLYGGSSGPKNVAELLESVPIDGFLVGGESLKPKHFGIMINAVNHARPTNSIN